MGPSLGLALSHASTVLAARRGGGGGTVYDFTSALPAAVSYARTGGATALTVSGAVRSFAANAAPLTNRGLLMEAANTNQILYGADLTQINGAASASTTITANYAVAPDGTATADRVQLLGGGAHYYTRTGTVPPGTYYGSFWVQATSTAQSVHIRMSASVASTPPTAVVAATTTPQRTPMLPITIGSSGWIEAGLDPRTVVGGDGFAKDLVVWGFQIATDQGSYIPTSGAAATRGLPTATLIAPSANWSATYGLSNTVASGSAPPGASFDLVTGRPWLGLGQELKSLVFS